MSNLLEKSKEKPPPTAKSSPIEPPTVLTLHAEEIDEEDESDNEGHENVKHKVENVDWWDNDDSVDGSDNENKEEEKDCWCVFPIAKV